MKLIDKDALVAEIEKLRKTSLEYGYTAMPKVLADTGKDLVLGQLLHSLNTLEVREMDIEDSIKETLAQKYIDYTFRRHNIDPESKEGQLIYYAYMHGMNQCLNQLKAQKGEKV